MSDVRRLRLGGRGQDEHMPCSHPQGNTIQSRQAFPQREAVEGKAERPRGLPYPSSSPSVLDDPSVGETGVKGQLCKGA